MPAFTPLAKAAAMPRLPLRSGLHSQRRHRRSILSEDRGLGVRVPADSEAAGAVQGLAGAGQQSDAVASGQPGGRSRGQRRGFSHRRVAQTDRGGGRPGEHDHRSDRRAADRAGYAAAVARSRHRGFHGLRRRLLAGFQLRLPEHDLVEHAVDAAADGDQPAVGVRADVRRAGHGGAARGADAEGTEHSRLDHRGGQRSSARSGHARSRPGQRLSR